MITSIPLLFSILWIPILSRINFSSTFILFGLYYGFLTTLPISPSQLLSMRAFLLGGYISGTVAISGLITGQLIVFLSVYYSPFYIILVKPHILSLLVLSYIFFYWYKIKDLLNYQSLRPITSFQDTRIFQLFFDSLIFQLLNPILLPSPVLARLLNLFFFRYSDNVLFLTSAILGWFCGQYLFFNLGKVLLFRLESDSPILYLLVKRIIHRIFSIIFFGFSLLHLGRTPVPFITKKIIDNLQFNSSKREESIFFQKSWPGLFFDYRRWKRPLRYIENSRFSNQSPMKGRVSQYFFNPCLSDGKPRLSFTYLPSVAVFEKNFGKYFNYLEFSPSSKFFGEWINIRRQKRKDIYNKFQHGVQFLDNGFTMTEVMEKETGLSNFRGKIFTKFYDPLLMGQGYEAMITSKSPWFFTEKYDKLQRAQKNRFFIKKNNKLKYWISNQWKDLEYKNFVLPWEPLTRDARRILGLLIDKSEKVKSDPNSKQVNFFDADTKIDSNGKSNILIGNMRKRVNRKSNIINWELILNLSTRQKNLYFNYLQIDEWNTLKNYWKNLFLGDITRVKNIFSFLVKTLGIDKKFLFREMHKEIPRWTPDLKNDKFDVIAIGVTDIRQRKVKNLGYLIKGKDRRRKIVRRFSQQSDFRRKLVKGSMRARRRKTLIWKMFQLKINSPFLLRMSEKPTFIRTYSNIQNIYGSELTFRNISKKRNENFLLKKFSLFEKTKADRLAIANRWDFPLAQWGRSWLLIIQSHFRKYLAQPLLIILKNISRLFLFQNPEWNEDWSEWNKEIHIRCTYDGTEVSKEELPEQWLRDGLQIKIIYPFRLKPWHNIKSRNRTLGKRKFHYCYLTAWGFLTDLPFGNMKEQPSFWKPINKEVKKKWRKNIFIRFFKQVEKKPFTIPDFIGSKKLDIQINKSSEFNFNNLESEKQYTEITIKNSNNIRELIESNNNNNNNIASKIPIKSERGTLIYIKNLEYLVTEKNKKETEVDLNQNKGKDYRFDEKAEKRKPFKRLIRIKQIIIRFYIKNVELVKKWLFTLNRNIKRIQMDFKIDLTIIKESIGNLFNN
uniref:Ycf1 n=1 Tax=Porella grandiloba TaxID=460656 RepID=UPI0023D7BA13|nr:Ycf1 [Porella grandiloba]WCQ78549.1 Ycf1 [Porella grandiloba]